jgi:aspartate-semialdehyde dehydrogenase
MAAQAQVERGGGTLIMADGMYRIGIVGAASLKGKELGEELQDSLLAASDFVLFDDEEATGQVTAVADEPAFIQRVEPGSFARMDFVFFAGDADSTLEHWQAARKAGASIIDMTYALEGERGVLVRAPLAGVARGARQLNLETQAVIAAHPAAVMLALVASRVQAAMKVESLAATVVEPASEHGREAMDELHQQTVNLLSFQNLPRDQYDAQIAFNLLPSLGAASKVKLGATEERIARHYALLSAGTLPLLDVELVQAPVFHGYVASVMLELEDERTTAQVEAAIAGDSIDIVADESDPPSNLSAAGQEDIMVRVRGAGRERGAASRRFWLWLAADNLKLGALNAIACANELKRLRPQGKVQ